MKEKQQQYEFRSTVNIEMITLYFWSTNTELYIGLLKNGTPCGIAGGLYHFQFGKSSSDAVMSFKISTPSSESICLDVWKTFLELCRLHCEHVL